jgi:hypothetical protein
VVLGRLSQGGECSAGVLRIAWSRGISLTLTSPVRRCSHVVAARGLLNHGAASDIGFQIHGAAKGELAVDTIGFCVAAGVKSPSLTSPARRCRSCGYSPRSSRSWRRTLYGISFPCGRKSWHSIELDFGSRVAAIRNRPILPVLSAGTGHVVAARGLLDHGAASGARPRHTTDKRLGCTLRLALTLLRLDVRPATDKGRQRVV